MNDQVSQEAVQPEVKEGVGAEAQPEAQKDEASVENKEAE